MKTSDPDSRDVRNLDSAHEECAHTCLLQKQGRVSRLKLPRTLALFPQLPKRAPQPKPSACCHSTDSMAQLNTRKKLPQLGKVHSCRGQSQLRPAMASGQGKGSHYWSSWRQKIGSGLELWCQDCLSTCPDRCHVLAPAPLAPSLLPSRV